MSKSKKNREAFRFSDALDLSIFRVSTSVGESKSATFQLPAELSSTTALIELSNRDRKRRNARKWHV